MRIPILLIAIIATLVVWLVLRSGGDSLQDSTTRRPTAEADSRQLSADANTVVERESQTSARIPISPATGGEASDKAAGSWLLHGTVQSTDGGSLGGAEITVSVFISYRSVNIGRTTSAADGGYQFDVSELRLRPAVDRAAIYLEVTASAAGHGESSVREALRGIATDQPHRFGANFKLQPMCRAVGRIVDQRGNPVAGAEVVFEESLTTDMKWEPDVTGTEGRFAISIVDSFVDSVQIAAEHPRHGRAVRTSLALVEGEDVDFGDIVLEAVSELRARILDRHGRPLSNATIGVFAEGSTEHIEGLLWTRTDESGVVDVRTLKPGSYRLVPNLWYAGKGAQPSLATGAEEHELRIDAVRLRLTFVDEGGAEVEPLGVHGGGYATEYSSILRGVLAGESFPPDLPMLVRIGAACTTEFYVPADTWWWFCTRDHDPGGDGGALVYVAAGQAVIEVPIVVRPIEKTARLIVRATLADGSELPELALWFEPLEPTRMPRWTMNLFGGGVFGFDMTPGRFRMRLRPAADYPDQPSFLLPCSRVVEVNAAKRRVLDVEFHRGGIVSVIVRLPGGAKRMKLAGFRMRLSPSGTSLAPYWYLHDDHWHWTDYPPSDPLSKLLSDTPIRAMRVLPAGRHVLALEIDGFAPATLSVLIEPGKVTQSEVRLEAR